MKWISSPDPKRAMQYFQERLIDEQPRWILWLPVAVGTGIVGYFHLSSEPPIWLGFGLCCGTGFVWFLCRRHLGGYLVLSFFLGVSIGFTAAQLRTYALSTVMLRSALSARDIEGTILQIEEMPSRLRLTLGDVQVMDARFSEPLSSVRLTLRGKFANAATKLKPGDRIHLDAVLLPPSEPVAPGAYDFRRKAYFAGISAVGFATSSPRLLKEGAKSFRLRLDRFRHSVTTLLRNGIGETEGAIAASLVTGDRAGIPENVRQAFADSGLAHILAISGLHLSIAAGLAFLLIRRGLSLFPFVVLRYPVKKWAAGAALVFAFCYLLVSGMSIPAQRACIMTSMVLLGILVDRTAITLRNVALTAIFILMIMPESLMSPSFQMSFAAVIALVSGYEALRQPLAEWQAKSESTFKRLCLYLFGILVSTILATAATTPYVIYTFNRFTLHAIPANLVSIPLLSFVIMPLLVVFLILSPFGLEGLVNYLLKVTVGWMIHIALEVSRWPGSVVFVRAMSPLGLALFTLGALWLTLWKTRWRWSGVAGIVASVCVMTLTSPPDLYVLAEKKLVALNGREGGIWVNSLRSGRFARESWMKMMATKKCDKFNNLLKKKAQKLLSVADKGYVFHAVAADVFLQEDSESFDHHSIHDDWLCRLVHQTTGQTLEADRLMEKGGHLVWITPQGFDIQTVADEVGNRPWCLRWIP